jgi:cytochrome c-type biogenesis protein CcmH
VIAEAERRLAEGVPPPPREPAGAAPAAAATAEGQVRIRVELSEEARARAGTGGLLFVTARPAGVASGPPVAAKRVPVEAFPVELTLGPADSMMGQPFPSPARIDVRLDRDGDAATREPDEPRAHAEGVEAGAEIRLVLQ